MALRPLHRLGQRRTTAGRRMRSEVFQETVEFWGRRSRTGGSTSFEPFLLEPHGGGLAGFMLVHGERAQLDDVRESEDFERLMARAERGRRRPRRDHRATAARRSGAQIGPFQEAAGELGGSR